MGIWNQKSVLFSLWTCSNPPGGQSHESKWSSRGKGAEWVESYPSCSFFRKSSLTPTTQIIKEMLQQEKVVLP
ncbi:Chromosome-Associated Kinesin Kif4B [Manis pentadactyla]|nr:Chromosome-Associated Kinesin Kif4B [Manis pentadactyla]